MGRAPLLRACGGVCCRLECLALACRSPHPAPSPPARAAARTLRRARFTASVRAVQELDGPALAALLRRRLPMWVKYGDWERGEHLQQFIALAWPTFNRMICGCAAWRAGLDCSCALLVTRPQLEGLHTQTAVGSAPAAAAVAAGSVSSLGACAIAATCNDISGARPPRRPHPHPQHHQARGGGAAGQPRRVRARHLCAPVLWQASAWEGGRQGGRRSSRLCTGTQRRGRCRREQPCAAPRALAMLRRGPPSRCPPCTQAAAGGDGGQGGAPAGRRAAGHGCARRAGWVGGAAALIPQPPLASAAVSTHTHLPVLLAPAPPAPSTTLPTTSPQCWTWRCGGRASPMW